MVKVHLYFHYVTDSYIFNKRRFLSDPVLVEQKAYPDQKGWFLPSNNNKILSCNCAMERGGHLHDICTIPLINRIFSSAKISLYWLLAIVILLKNTIITLDISNAFTSFIKTTVV